METPGGFAEPLDEPCGFFEQDFQLRLRFNVELQDARAGLAATRCVAQRLREFLHAFCPRRKRRCDRRESQDRPRCSSSPPETMSNPQPCWASKFQNREIAVGLHGKTKQMRQFAEAAIAILQQGIVDGLAAVNVRGRSKPSAISTALRLRNKHLRPDASAFFFQANCGVNVAGSTYARFSPGLGVGAHFTFTMTSVRSSESGAFCENQSTSFKHDDRQAPRRCFRDASRSACAIVPCRTIALRC